MRVREHRGFGHGLPAGRDSDMNCGSCAAEAAAGMTPRIRGTDNEVTQPAAVMVTGAADIEHVRWLAVRSALKLEISGLRASGRRPSARKLANDITGQDHRSARKAYAALNDHIVTAIGEQFARPLETAKGRS